MVVIDKKYQLLKNHPSEINRALFEHDVNRVTIKKYGFTVKIPIETHFMFVTGLPFHLREFFLLLEESEIVDPFTNKKSFFNSKGFHWSKDVNGMPTVFIDEEKGFVSIKNAIHNNIKYYEEYQ